METEKLKVFEEIKQLNQYGQEFWSARKIAEILEYVEYRNFIKVVNKAKISCENSGQSVQNHFGDLTDMVAIGSNTSRPIEDIALSRYACYLIMQNADPSKEVVALGQTYFALQTRRQELSDQIIEDQKRVYLRDEVTSHNKHLATTASSAGVKNFGLFTNYGYMGLYGGLKQKDIQKRKKIPAKANILDHMGSEELAANLFRATQTDAKIQREKIKGEANANQAHFHVGRKIRQTIKELGGTMPERLSATDPISRSRKRLKSKT